MITVKSTRGRTALADIRPASHNPVLTHIDLVTSCGVPECATVPTADLLDALGAVPAADMAREIAEAQCEVNEWRARAERANEALAATQGRCNEHVQEASERAEVAQAKAAALAAERDRLLATIERIDAVRRDFYEVRGDWADPEGAAALKAQMERAILGDPQFTLPTEAGAEFWADNDGEPQRFTTVDSHLGTLYVSGPYAYTADGVMQHFTDHRLIGADQ